MGSCYDDANEKCEMDIDGSKVEMIVFPLILGCYLDCGDYYIRMALKGY